MSIFNKNNSVKQEPELQTIVISMLGGSTSGKTTFLAGILQSFANGVRIVPNDPNTLVTLKPLKIIPGVISDSGNGFVNDESAAIGEQELNNIFSQLNNAGAGGGAPAFGGGSAPAFGGGTAFNDNTMSNTDVKRIDANLADSDEQVGVGLKLKRELDRLLDYQKGFQAPTSVTRFIEFKFVLEIHTKPVCILSITDYAGELVDAKTDTVDTVLSMLSKHISRSDGIIMLANARELSKHVKDQYRADESMFINNAERAVASISIFKIFQDLPKMEDLAVLLAITQTDSPQVKESVSRDDYRRTANDLKTSVFRGVFDWASINGWSRGVVPVSAVGKRSNGEPNVDANNVILKDAEFIPKNIDRAIMYILYNAVLSHERMIRAEQSKPKFSWSDEEKELHNKLAERSKGKFFPTLEKKQRKKDLEDYLEKLREIRMCLSGDKQFFDCIYGTDEEKFHLEKVSEVSEVTWKKS